ATSEGSERCRWQLGWVSWLSLIRSPLASIAPIRLAYSASEPVHQWIEAGWVSLATDSTQLLSDAFDVVIETASSRSEAALAPLQDARRSRIETRDYNGTTRNCPAAVPRPRASPGLLSRAIGRSRP